MTLTSSQFLLVLNHETNKIRLERWIIKLEYTYINQIHYFLCSILLGAFCCWYKSSVAYVIVTLPISWIGQNFCRDYRLDDRATGVRSPEEAKDVLCSLCVQTSSETHPASRHPIPGVKCGWGVTWGQEWVGAIPSLSLVACRDGFTFLLLFVWSSE
jgi:hypothetical protein